MADSNIEIKALGEANMPDNNTKFITPAKMRETFGAMLNHLGGNLYFTSADGAQSITADTETKLTGDFNTTGYKVTAYRPWYVDADYIVGTDSAIQLRDMKNASFVSMRFEVNLSVPANTAVQIIARAKNSSGTKIFDINVEDLYFKSAVTRTKTSNFFFFMDTDIEDGTLELYINADNDVDAIWQSFLIDMR